MGSSEDPSLINNVDELGLVYYGLICDCSVGIVNGLRTGGSRFPIPAVVIYLSVLQKVRTVPGTPPGSYLIGTGVLFQG